MSQLFVFNHSQVKGKRGASQRKVVQGSFSPSTCCNPPDFLARQSRVRKVEGGRGQGRGRRWKKAGCVRIASCLWGGLLC